MGEVGARLRDERERRGIGIDEIEAETRIRAKFLLAIEEERFDALPGPAYVRAFVRDYAEQLGLDPQELVAELNARPDLVEDVVMMPPRQVATVPLFDPRARIAVWALAVVLIAAIVAIGIVVLGSRGSGSSAGGGPTGRTPPLGGSGPGPGTTQPATTAATGTTTPVASGRSGRARAGREAGQHVALGAGRVGHRPGALPEHPGLWPPPAVCAAAAVGARRRALEPRPGRRRAPAGRCRCTPPATCW